MIQKVKIIQYREHLCLFNKGKELAKYHLPADGVKNQRFAPEGTNLKYQPRHRKKTSHEEETFLRSLGPSVNEYVEFVKSKESGIHYKNEYLRRLYFLSKKLSQPLFHSTIKRALTYRVNKIESLSRIAVLSMNKKDIENPDVHHDPGYMDREEYKKGRFNDETGINDLGSLFNRDDEDENQA